MQRNDPRIVVIDTRLQTQEQEQLERSATSMLTRPFAVKVDQAMKLVLPAGVAVEDKEG